MISVVNSSDYLNRFKEEHSDQNSPDIFFDFLCAAVDDKHCNLTWDDVSDLVTVEQAHSLDSSQTQYQSKSFKR
jgi:hypothetical protein